MAPVDAPASPVGCVGRPARGDRGLAVGRAVGRIWNEVAWLHRDPASRPWIRIFGPGDVVVGRKTSDEAASCGQATIPMGCRTINHGSCHRILQLGTLWSTAP